MLANQQPNSSSSDASSSNNTSSSFNNFGIDSAEVSGLLTKMKSRKWAATFRAPPIFFGQQLFSRPRTTQEAFARVEANVPYFLTNYLAICAVVVLITLLSKPWLIFVGLILGAMWWFATKEDELRIGSVVLQGRNKMMALMSVTAIVVFIAAGTTIFFLVGCCATIVLLHAVLHTLPPLEEAEMDEFEASPA